MWEVLNQALNILFRNTLQILLSNKFFLDFVVTLSFYVFLVDLLGLLKWRSHTSLLQQNLRQLMKVEGGEVVKVRVLYLKKVTV